MADGEGLVAAATCLTARTRGFKSLCGRWRMGRDWSRDARPVSAFGLGSNPRVLIRSLSGGWGGIRTLGALLHTRFPSVRIRPLCHPSGKKFHLTRAEGVSQDSSGPLGQRTLPEGEGFSPVQRRADSHSSTSRSRAESPDVAARRMKRRSISVFTPVSRTQGVGHRRGDPSKFLPRPGIEPRFKV
jgi:hypothetical protein